MPRLCRSPESASDFSTLVVPTSTGRPFSCSSSMFSAMAKNFSRSER